MRNTLRAFFKIFILTVFMSQSGYYIEASETDELAYKPVVMKEFGLKVLVPAQWSLKKEKNLYEYSYPPDEEGSLSEILTFRPLNKRKSVKEILTEFAESIESLPEGTVLAMEQGKLSGEVAYRVLVRYRMESDAQYIFHEVFFVERSGMNMRIAYRAPEVTFKKNRPLIKKVTESLVFGVIRGRGR
ncbi:MAG: hypothetical protein P9M03_12280 [Candidatus Theseobacter exili]|nr:hypothetical protein [Candidatus Theseobacter exili]